MHATNPIPNAAKQHQNAINRIRGKFNAWNNHTAEKQDNISTQDHAPSADIGIPRS